MNKHTEWKPYEDTDIKRPSTRQGERPQGNRSASNLTSNSEPPNCGKTTSGFEHKLYIAWGWMSSGADILSPGTSSRDHEGKTKVGHMRNS